MNRKKGMEFYGLWLMKAEEKSLKESLKDVEKFGNNIIEIMDEANKRGDLNRR